MMEKAKFQYSSMRRIGVRNLHCIFIPFSRLLPYFVFYPCFQASSHFPYAYIHTWNILQFNLVKFNLFSQGIFLKYLFCIFTAAYSNSFNTQSYKEKAKYNCSTPQCVKLAFGMFTRSTLYIHIHIHIYSILHIPASTTEIFCILSPGKIQPFLSVFFCENAFAILCYASNVHVIMCLSLFLGMLHLCRLKQHIGIRRIYSLMRQMNINFAPKMFAILFYASNVTLIIYLYPSS
jgi:hypothetical protein